MWIVALLLSGCVADFSAVPLPRRWGPADPREDTGQPLDTGDPAQDSDPPDDPPDDSDPPEDDPPDDTIRACYPGPSGTWTTCVDLVDFSSSWGSDYAYPAPYNGSAQYAEPDRFIDLSAANPDLSLAANFVLDEVMQEHKGRYALFQPHVIEHMQAIRTASGGSITVNSGYRSPGYNESVGGVTHSRHMYGDAADMDPSAVSLDRLAELCYAEGAGYVGMYSTFVHCDWRNDPLDPAFHDGARGPLPERAPLPVHSARVVRSSDGSLRAPATGFDEGEPYRLWRAWDASGALVTEQRGARFLPPPGARRIVVEVGGQVAVELSW
jgi:hypothetical protein